jgi:hypothetical protein
VSFGSGTRRQSVKRPIERHPARARPGRRCGSGSETGRDTSTRGPHVIASLRRGRPGFRDAASRADRVSRHVAATPIVRRRFIRDGKQKSIAAHYGLTLAFHDSLSRLFKSKRSNMSFSGDDPMRLTIRINGSESETRQSYAVLWVDTDEGLWSREAHQGIDLPSWGKVRDVEGEMALCAGDSGSAVCQLKGLTFGATQREQGPAVLAGAHPAGAWRLQAVDRCTTRPEYQEFISVAR